MTTLSFVAPIQVSMPASTQQQLVPALPTPVSKRLLDLMLCLPALVVLAPLFALVALVIKLQDGGPVFYRSIRIGKAGVPFEFLKFRTMVVNADSIKAALLDQNVHGSGITFKMKKDPRITWFGSFLRRFSIDELPQLWNVIRGEMSLVGPRPAVPSEVARYTRADMDRLQVIPGITCIWQVSGRSEIPFERQVEMDREYIAKQSLTTDLVLLCQTIPAVLHGKGAY